MNRFFRRLIRIILGCFFALLVILIIAGGVLSMPQTQTKIAQWATGWLRDRYDVDVQLDKAWVVLPRTIYMEGLRIFDDHGDTLFYAPDVEVKIGWLGKEKLAFTKVEMDQPYIRMLLSDGDSLNNWQVFINKFTPEVPSEHPFVLKMDDVQLHDVEFRKYLGSDSLHYHFRKSQVQVLDFVHEDGSVDARISNISFLGRRLDLVHLSGVFLYRKDNGIALARTHLKTNNSEVLGDLALEVNENADYSEFVDNVRISARLRKVDVESDELQRFVEVFPDLGRLKVSGDFTGTLNELNGKDVRVSYGHQTSASADILLRNAANKTNLHMDISLGYFRSNFDEFAHLLKVVAGEDISFAKDYLETFTFSGDFVGEARSFHSNGTLLTDYGTIDMELDFSGEGKSLEHAGYKGKISGRKIKLGQIAGVKEMGLANFEAKIEGSGLSAELFNARVNGLVSNVEYHGYNYQNLSVVGHFQELYFDGKVQVNDPNLKLSFEGTANFDAEDLRLDFIAFIDHADVHRLGFFPDDTLYKLNGETTVNLARNERGDWVGEINVGNFLVERSERVYFFRDIQASSYERGMENVLSVNSDFLEVMATGQFGITDIYVVVLQTLKNRSSFVKSDTLYVPAYFNLTMKTGDTRILTDLFLPNLTVSPNTTLALSHDGNKGHTDFQFQSPEISWKKWLAQDIDLIWNETGGKKLPVILTVENVSTGALFLERVRLESNVYHDFLQFDIHADFDPQVGGKVHLAGEMKQLDTSVFNLSFSPTDWYIGQGKFSILEGNEIFIQDGSLIINDFEMESDGRRMMVNGGISSSPYEILRVELEDFSVDVFNFLLSNAGFQLHGVLEGELIFNSLLDKPRFASNLRIDSLMVNNHWQGDLYLDSEWYISDQYIELDAHLERGTLRTLAISGQYYPESEDNKLTVVTTLNRFRINPITPFLTSFTDNVRGVASGQVHITGSFAHPKLSGELTVPNLGLSVPYLNTDYNMEGVPTVRFTSTTIVIPKARIRDTKEGTAGTVVANLTHKNFKDWGVDVHIDAERLLMLNTNLLINDYYYGKAFVTGDIDIKGPAQDLNLLVDVRTNRGTQFFIPIDGPADANPMKFVDFVKPENEDDDKRERVARIEESGLNLQFNIDVTPDAEVVLIMDQRTGETIRGNGKGKLRLNLDPQGNISLFGSLEINRGEYLFTLGGLVRKRFTIEPGGTIVFNGDPYEATLDITSKYVTRTSLSGAVYDQNLASVRTEVNLFLHLEGALQNPEIKFDIKLPNVAPGIQAEVADRFADPNRLTQQAFSLLALNAFYADDLGLDAQVSGGIANTTYDVVSGQVNSFLSQYIKVVDIAVNYTGEGATGASQEEFEVAMSRRLLDDRVSINGVVGVPLGANQNQLAGDVEVEVMLTNDGRVRAKAFNRSYQNNLLIEQTGLYSQGVGLFYRTDFDRRRELLKRLILFRRSSEEG